MGQLVISGSLTGGPTPVSEGIAFPQAQFVTLLLRTKSFGRASGVLPRMLSDAVQFVQLGAVPSDVPQVTTLYARGEGSYSLRLTQQSGVPVTVECTGIVLMEFPPTNPLVNLEAAADGQIEYFVSGP